MHYLIITKSGREYNLFNIKHKLSDLIDEINKITANGFLVFEDIAIMKSDISTVKLIK